jgi:hypothetical protein
VQQLLVVRLVGLSGSADVGRHLALLGFMESAGAVGWVGVAAGGPAGALVGQLMGAVGPPDDRSGG